MGRRQENKTLEIVEDIKNKIHPKKLIKKKDFLVSPTDSEHPVRYKLILKQKRDI